MSAPSNSAVSRAFLPLANIKKASRTGMLKTLLMEAFMQIKGLHKNVCRLYAYSRTQECLDVYREKYADKVHRWETLI